MTKMANPRSKKLKDYTTNDNLDLFNTHHVYSNVEIDKDKEIATVRIKYFHHLKSLEIYSLIGSGSALTYTDLEEIELPGGKKGRALNIFAKWEEGKYDRKNQQVAELTIKLDKTFAEKPFFYQFKSGNRRLIIPPKGLSPWILDEYCDIIIPPIPPKK